jgi:hypothetical protein
MQRMERDQRRGAEREGRRWKGEDEDVGGVGNKGEGGYGMGGKLHPAKTKFWLYFAAARFVLEQSTSVD